MSSTTSVYTYAHVVFWLLVIANVEGSIVVRDDREYVQNTIGDGATNLRSSEVNPEPCEPTQKIIDNLKKAFSPGGAYNLDGSYPDVSTTNIKTALRFTNCHGGFASGLLKACLGVHIPRLTMDSSMPACLEAEAQKLAQKQAQMHRKEAEVQARAQKQAARAPVAKRKLTLS